MTHDDGTYTVNGIHRTQLLEQRDQLKEVLESGYGIFSGKAVTWAKLRFSPERARWVANERWHSQQKGKLETDGSYMLEIPYSDDRELLMDILRHGSEVSVIGPKKLRDRIAEELKKTMKFYG